MMHLARKRFLLSLMFLAAAAVDAESVVVQIGGGNHIDNSQGQIEANVIWLNRILRNNGVQVHNFFGSGVQTEKDVAVFVEKDLNGPMMVLSRVFGNPDSERVQYRHNHVPALSGSMYKEEIMESLGGVVKGVTDQHDFLLIYNGHGQMDKTDIRNNALKIWGQEKITVAEVDGLFDKAPSDATLRFVFPQCFSGGFYHLIFEHPHSTKFSRQHRCGFMSESPYDQSEGCSLSANKEEYRDYSTYFFAPLNGKTRTGEELVVNPDLDANGEISFSESHIYAIKAGQSKDLSRSTSEVFLESWMPWYLQWTGGQGEAQSKFRDIAEYVANREGYELNDRKLDQRRRAFKGRLEDLRQEEKNCKKEAKQIAKRLKKQAIKHWPELLHPYTSDYIMTLVNQSDKVADFIKANSDYPVLVETQNACLAHEKAILDVERDLAQVEKIKRYLKLASIEYYFNRFASDAEQAQYESLLKCEDGVFFTLP